LVKRRRRGYADRQAAVASRPSPTESSTVLTILLIILLILLLTGGIGYSRRGRRM
jgi:hypothetical protein